MLVPKLSLGTRNSVCLGTSMGSTLLSGQNFTISRLTLRKHGANVIIPEEGFEG